MSAELVRLSVVVPYHRNLAQLEQCLRALEPLPRGVELLIAADGAVDRCHELAATHGAVVIEIEGPRGPAVARNRAAAAATGDVLVFIDSDVVPARGVLEQFRSLFREHPDVAAVFGAYDEQPGDGGFMSQYRNLAHSYFHQQSNREARTFWAGLGAIRRAVFDEVGGFDERFSRPCVEDIELGYRVSSAGHRVLLEPSIRGCHLKRWTLKSSVMSDVCDRGIPWTQLILRFGRLDNDLNLQRNQRVAVVLAYVLLALLALAPFTAMSLPLAAATVVALAALNWRYYGFFLQRRGPWFAARVFPVHVLHHLCNGISFAIGSVLYYTAYRVGTMMPGTLPLTRWNGAPHARSYEHV
jgi:GT2 family glycosyltransferase